MHDNIQIREIAYTRVLNTFFIIGPMLLDKRSVDELMLPLESCAQEYIKRGGGELVNDYANKLKL